MSTAAADRLDIAGVGTRAFHIALLQQVLPWEGGYSDHPDDPGGATMKGLTIEVFRRWRNNPRLTKEDLKQVTAREIYEIYYTWYWKAVRGDQLKPAIAAMLFDAAVNSSPANAVQALQNAINAARWAPTKLKVDGRMGPATIAAANALNEMKLINEFTVRRAWFYGVLKTFRVFGIGWLRRLLAGQSLAQSLVGATAETLDAMFDAFAARQQIAAQAD